MTAEIFFRGEGPIAVIAHEGEREVIWVGHLDYCKKLNKLIFFYYNVIMKAKLLQQLSNYLSLFGKTDSGTLNYTYLNNFDKFKKSLKTTENKELQNRTFEMYINS